MIRLWIWLLVLRGCLCRLGEKGRLNPLVLNIKISLLLKSYDVSHWGESYRDRLRSRQPQCRR
jgi:hypothetical protein